MWFFATIENAGESIMTPPLISKTLEHMKHRGPDFAGTKIVNDVNSGKQITFIHTRLAINGSEGASYLNTSELTVKTWEPKWSKISDPSGRVQPFWKKN